MLGVHANETGFCCTATALKLVPLTIPRSPWPRQPVLDGDRLLLRGDFRRHDSFFQTLQKIAGVSAPFAGDPPFKSDLPDERASGRGEERKSQSAG